MSGAAGRRLQCTDRGFMSLDSSHVDPAGRAVCGFSLAGIAGSNSAGGMDVCLLRALCVVR